MGIAMPNNPAHCCTVICGYLHAEGSMLQTEWQNRAAHTSVALENQLLREVDGVAGSNSAERRLRMAELSFTTSSSRRATGTLL